MITECGRFSIMKDFSRSLCKIVLLCCGSHFSAVLNKILGYLKISFALSCTESLVHNQINLRTSTEGMSRETHAWFAKETGLKLESQRGQTSMRSPAVTMGRDLSIHCPHPQHRPTWPPDWPRAPTQSQLLTLLANTAGPCQLVPQGRARRRQALHGMLLIALRRWNLSFSMAPGSEILHPPLVVFQRQT